LHKKSAEFLLLQFWTFFTTFKSYNSWRIRRSRRALWTILTKVWRGVCGLFLVETVGGDLIWSLGVIRVSRSFFYLFGDSSTLQKYTNFIYNLYLVQLSNIQDYFDILDIFFNLYTNYTYKMSTIVNHSPFPLYFHLEWNNQIHGLSVDEWNVKIEKNIMFIYRLLNLKFLIIYFRRNKFKE
jgi:hypothetical protein